MSTNTTAAPPALPASTPLPQGVVRLDDWGVIRAHGADAASFLHGQLTQDVLHLDEGHARLAGYCSAKGRLLASFVMWRRGPEEILLACSADLLPVVLKRLSMFVLRAKCKLSDASADWPLWGLAGDAAAVAPTGAWARAAKEATEWLRLPDAVVDGRAVARALAAGPETPAGPALDAQAWRWLEVRSGVARISAATSEQFVPQMVNLELVGGVNFQKGCYPGQEVVARSQYRGTLKRRARIVESTVALQPAQEVYHDGDPGQPAGMVVLAGQWGGRHAALAELKLAALGGGSLHAGSADGPVLTPVPLPYELPAEAV
ncbi:MAG: folate-binding protein YgfZ [Leptothrix sp. (in: Bacteria)]|nr:folate-binding protein YgfZ [Leptothrix sp. (in: b-proteobacteria)]